MEYNIHISYIHTNIQRYIQTPILWLRDVKNQLIGKDPDAGKIEGGGEGDDRGWDGCMASPTWQTWVWVGSGSWWWAETPGLLQSMESQRVGLDWATELNWTYVQKSAQFIHVQADAFPQTRPCDQHPGQETEGHSYAPIPSPVPSPAVGTLLQEQPGSWFISPLMFDLFYNFM